MSTSCVEYTALVPLKWRKCNNSNQALLVCPQSGWLLPRVDLWQNGKNIWGFPSLCLQILPKQWDCRYQKANSAEGNWNHWNEEDSQVLNRTYRSRFSKLNSVFSLSSTEFFIWNSPLGCGRDCSGLIICKINQSWFLREMIFVCQSFTYLFNSFLYVSRSLSYNEGLRLCIRPW